jgi:hypothetical protein
MGKVHRVTVNGKSEENISAPTNRKNMVNATVL